MHPNYNLQQTMDRLKQLCATAALAILPFPPQSKQPKFTELDRVRQAVVVVVWGGPSLFYLANLLLSRFTRYGLQQNGLAALEIGALADIAETLWIILVMTTGPIVGRMQGIPETYQRTTWSVTPFKAALGWIMPTLLWTFPGSASCRRGDGSLDRMWHISEPWKNALEGDSMLRCRLRWATLMWFFMVLAVVVFIGVLVWICIRRLRRLNTANGDFTPRPVANSAEMKAQQANAAELRRQQAEGGQIV